MPRKNMQYFIKTNKQKTQPLSMFLSLEDMAMFTKLISLLPFFLELPIEIRIFFLNFIFKKLHDLYFWYISVN